MSLKYDVVFKKWFDFARNAVVISLHFSAIDAGSISIDEENLLHFLKFFLFIIRSIRFRWFSLKIW